MTVKTAYHAQVFCGFTHHKRWLIWKYIAYHRKSQYWRNYKWKTVIDRGYAAIVYRLCLRKKNKYGECSGIEIGNLCRIGRNLNIFHGGVVINADLGDNVVLHGNNILGNKGTGRSAELPTIGDNVDIGAGAVIIGNIHIANGCIVGANAVVTKSCEQENAVLVGIPAEIKTRVSREQMP